MGQASVALRYDTKTKRRKLIMRVVIGISKDVDWWSCFAGPEYLYTTPDKDQAATFCTGYAKGVEKGTGELMNAVLEELVVAYGTHELPESVKEAVLNASKKVDFSLSEKDNISET